MKKHWFLLCFSLLCMTTLNARPIDEARAKDIGHQFVCSNFHNNSRTNDLQLVYTGISNRGEACFYTYNVGETGFVIVSADDRFRPIVGYSDEGPFETENMSPELRFYLNQIVEARSNRNAVLFDDTEDEWQSVATSGKLLSRNDGHGVDYICQTKWNQDSPYNLYAPDADGGPGGRCYAGCVATAMSQVMKHWDYPQKGTGSHTYSSGGWWGPYYPNLTANFGQTYYDWKNMPIKITSSSPQEQIEAIAKLMYHCGVSVEMEFSADGSGAYSRDVPDAIQRYFSYSPHSNLKSRENYTLRQWQNMLKESFDLGWPVYYAGHSSEGGHAFVCDGYDDNDLFHFNWGWGGSGDGWFVIDEIDYNNSAAAVFDFVPSDVYDYMPLQPENLTVEPSGNFDYAATLTWTNPTQNIHLDNLTLINQIVVTRNNEIIHTQDNVTPGASMTFTDHYMPAIVNYSVYAIVHNAKGLVASENDIMIGPSCPWTIEMTSSADDGWNDGALSFVNTTGMEIAHVNLGTTSATQTVQLPVGHVDIRWVKPNEPIEHLSFNIKNSVGRSKVSFEGSSSDIDKGLFYIASNTCSQEESIPNGPTNLSAVLVGSHVALSWDALEDQNVTHYQIYRNNNLYAVTTATHFTDTENLDAFRSYYVTAQTESAETFPSNVCNLQPGSACEAPTNLRYELTSPTKVKLSWDAPQAEGLTGYIVYRRPKGEAFKRIKLLTSTYFTDNLANQADSHFQYVVVAYYKNSDCTSSYASAQDHPELNFIEVNKTIIPQHLDFVIHEGHVVLQWEKASLAERYNIYRNGILIGHTSETDFVDYTATDQNNYHYYVTGKTDFLESNPSNTIYVDWTTISKEQFDNQNIAIYPNPTENLITIEAEQLRQIQVFNVTGQAVQRHTMNSDRAVIDLSTEPQGCYFIEVTTESGCKTTKIIRL